ncbi:MAG: outer membrane protein transport protein [Pseudomonadota bacterium]
MKKIILKFVTSIVGAWIGCCGGLQNVQAGGFAIREQSVSALGSAFAGVAVGSDISSMFWNPAAVANTDGTNMESHVFGAVFENKMTATESQLAGTVDLLASPNITSESGEYSDPALVAASYANYQLTHIDPNLYMGIGINSPFGLVTKPDNLGGSDPQWAGAFLGTTSKVFTLNFNPTVAYKVRPNLTIGAGLQVQYMDAKLKFATLDIPTLSAAPNATLKGDDIEAGFTAGILWEPTKKTKVGFGFRSSIAHKLDGTFEVPESARVAGSNIEQASIDFETPELFTVSLRHAVTPKFSVMSTFEYSNWSRLDQLVVEFENVNNVGTPVVLDFGWDDGWLVSGGVEYIYNSELTLRAGGGFERSPVQDATQRALQVPDADRIWLSVGATYKYDEKTTLDFAYTHVFVEDGDIEREAAIAPITVVGESEAAADIIGLSFKRKLGGIADALPALK